MKNRKIISMLLSAVIAISLLAVPANAATAETVTARWNSHVTINYQGQPQNFTDVTGLNMYPISYNDSTYLPIRAVCGLAGLGVDWDNATKTIILTSNGTPVDYTATPARIEDASVEVKLAKDITVTLDGVEQTFTDANGTVIYPISYMGTNYLPVRAVCGLANISVEWIQETATIELNKLEGPVTEVQTVYNKEKLSSYNVDLSTLKLPEGLTCSDGVISGDLPAGEYVIGIWVGNATHLHADVDCDRDSYAYIHGWMDISAEICNADGSVYAEEDYRTGGFRVGEFDYVFLKLTVEDDWSYGGVLSVFINSIELAVHTTTETIVTTNVDAFTITTESVDLSTLDLPEGISYANGTIVGASDHARGITVTVPTYGADRIRISYATGDSQVYAVAPDNSTLAGLRSDVSEFSCTGLEYFTIEAYARDNSWTITGIERIYYTSNIEIPEGAYVLDSTNSGLSGDRSAYGDDYIYLDASNRSANTGGYLYFKNPGYTKLTFTFVADTRQLMRVACQDTFEGGWLFFNQFDVATEHTVTLDVSGRTSMYINAMYNSADTYITGAYLHD